MTHSNPALANQLSSSYWHDLAAHVRLKAAATQQAEVKRILLQIAERYDAMAKRIEARDPSRIERA